MGACPVCSEHVGELMFDDSQAEHLERVSERIAPVVIRYCTEHPRFHADELRRYVLHETGLIAPGSADRILRDLRLRLRGVIDYRVVSRRESLYEVLRVPEVPKSSGN